MNALAHASLVLIVFLVALQGGTLLAGEGNVLISEHKEQELDDVAQRYPARQYVLVEDADVSIDRIGNLLNLNVQDLTAVYEAHRR